MEVNKLNGAPAYLFSAISLTDIQPIVRRGSSEVGSYTPADPMATLRVQR